MIEQLRTPGGVVRDLKAAGQNILEDEQALNVIRALPDTELWWNFLQVMAHNENIKTFDAISKHLQMEDEHKSLALPNVALVAKGSKPKGKRPFRGKQAKKGQRSLQNSRPRKGITKKQKAKGNRDKNIARVKSYSCGRKGHYAQACLEPSKVPFPTKTLDKCVFPCICY